MIIPTQAEKSCVSSFCVHLLHVRMYVCVLMVALRLTGRAKSKKEMRLSYFPALLQRCPTPAVQAVPKRKVGAEASSKAINNQVCNVRLSVFHFCTQGQLCRVAYGAERSVSGTSLHQTQAPRAHRPAQECTALFSAAVIWLQERG